jgi:hypothetical protein
MELEIIPLQIMPLMEQEMELKTILLQITVLTVQQMELDKILPTIIPMEQEMEIEVILQLPHFNLILFLVTSHP